MMMPSVMTMRMPVRVAMTMMMVMVKFTTMSTIKFVRLKHLLNHSKLDVVLPQHLLVGCIISDQHGVFSKMH